MRGKKNWLRTTSLCAGIHYWLCCILQSSTAVPNSTYKCSCLYFFTLIWGLENKRFLDQDFLTQPGTIKSLHAYSTSFCKVCTNWKYSPTSFFFKWMCYKLLGVFIQYFEGMYLLFSASTHWSLVNRISCLHHLQDDDC